MCDKRVGDCGGAGELWDGSADVGWRFWVEVEESWVARGVGTGNARRGGNDVAGNELCGRSWRME